MCVVTDPSSSRDDPWICPICDHRPCTCPPATGAPSRAVLVDPQRAHARIDLDHRIHRGPWLPHITGDPHRDFTPRHYDQRLTLDT